MKNINKENEAIYKKLHQEHILDGGGNPVAYAITELIKKAIIDKTYKHYLGGGYENKTQNPIKIYDVVVWFNFGGDPFFQVCMDNTSGDSCDLYSSNAACEILKKVL